MSGTLRQLLKWGCLAAFVVIPVMLIVSGLRYAPEAPSRTRCLSQLRNVALALQTYATKNDGRLPPAFVTDESGRPMHSWRVLLLPYLEQQALYDQYNFEEPWDGPNNSKLAGQIPDVYRCVESDAPSTFTNYVAIVGPHTLWPGAEPGTLDRIPDGAPHTLFLVEVRNSGIHWMEPRDLDVGQMAMAVNPATGQGISSAHGRMANVIYADGHGGPLHDDVNPDILRQLIDIDDGEPESEELP